MMDDQVEEIIVQESQFYVDAKVVLRSGIVHEYAKVDPIPWRELEPDQDWLVIRQDGKEVMAYSPGWWSAIITSRPIVFGPQNTISKEVEIDLGLKILRKELVILSRMLSDERKKRVALEVGFSELRQHLGPLLAILNKDE